MVWRLGTVPYLNADPLAAALREPDAERLVGEPVSLEALIPAELLPRLLDGALDAALVSTGGVLPHESLRVLPGGCVSSRGPVCSIQLYCRRPVHAVKTVALDASSRSAVALARVLFAERWRTAPRFITRPPHLSSMLEEADAALLIGNPALQANQVLDAGGWAGPPLERLDLGAEWDDLTGLPFVYAVWASPVERQGQAVDHERLTALLLRAREWGLRHRPALAQRGAEELRLPEELCYHYLTEAIRYDLGPAERAGMERFCELAVRHGVLPPSSVVRFAG
ncbi:MAG: putative periplasmic solute-binding protein [Armatimonadetes bacterium]|nr:putative periplasmic solute-binding protein [Armatimonadota bacterium]